MFQRKNRSGDSFVFLGFFQSAGSFGPDSGKTHDLPQKPCFGETSDLKITNSDMYSPDLLQIIARLLCHDKLDFERQSFTSRRRPSRLFYLCHNGFCTREKNQQKHQKNSEPCLCSLVHLPLCVFSMTTMEQSCLFILSIFCSGNKYNIHSGKRKGYRSVLQPKEWCHKTFMLRITVIVFVRKEKGPQVNELFIIHRAQNMESKWKPDSAWCFFESVSETHSQVSKVCIRGEQLSSGLVYFILLLFLPNSGKIV